MKAIKLLLQVISGENGKIAFADVPEHSIFSYGGVLYTKLFSQDLKEYRIKNVNAVGILSGGLTYFYPDEVVRIERTISYRAKKTSN